LFKHLHYTFLFSFEEDEITFKFMIFNGLNNKFGIYLSQRSPSLYSILNLDGGEVESFQVFLVWVYEFN